MAVAKQWIVGNWKMNGSLEMLAQYVPALLAGLADHAGWSERVRVVLCPPLPYVEALRDRLSDTPVGCGAQNVHSEPKGAFTGEVAAPMLADIGAAVCIVGHSERRQYFAETDEQVRAKAQALLQARIVPIVCVGETLEQREAGQANDVVARQVRGALADFDPAHAERLALAYEPVWAIGTGVTATPEQAGEMHAHVRGLLSEQLGAAGESVPILYGGSVNADNAADLLAKPEINGALVGGASLSAEKFLPIIHAALS